MAKQQFQGSLKVMVTPGAIKTIFPHTTVFEFPLRTTWAEIVSAKFFSEFLISMHNPVSPFDMSFRRKAFPALTHYLKSLTDPDMIVFLT